MLPFDAKGIYNLREIVIQVGDSQRRGVGAG